MLNLGASAQALKRRYVATMDDSKWSLTENSSILCRIEHPTLRSGKAVFTQEAGRGLQLELRSRHQFERVINVELRSESAGWNSRETRAVLGRFETNGRRTLFKIPPEVAQHAYYELRQGYQPGFLFYEDNPLIASLSKAQAVNRRVTVELRR